MYCRTYWIDFEIFVCIPLPRFFHHKRKQKLTQKFRRGSWLVPARLALALTQWDLFFCRSWCHWNWCHVPRNRRRIQHIWRGIKNKNLIFRSKYPKELKMSHTNNISNFVTITWYIFNLFQKSKHYVPFLEKLFTDLVVSCKYATFSFHYLLLLSRKWIFSQKREAVNITVVSLNLVRANFWGLPIF